jgi:hypothetical protein
MNENNKIQNLYEGIYSELSAEEEVEIMSDNDVNCRDYKESDYVSLKNGGEGNILKIIYVVMDNNDEILFLKKNDLGNLTQKDI